MLPLPNRVFGQWRRAAKLASLGFNDWCVLAEAIVTLAVLQAGSHVVEFPRLLSWATRTPGVVLAGTTREDIQRVTWLLGLCGRLTRTRCLTQCLALVRLLSRRGVVSELRIGVRRENDRLHAHAWVELMGEVLNDKQHCLQSFAAFDRAI